MWDFFIPPDWQRLLDDPEPGIFSSAVCPLSHKSIFFVLGLNSNCCFFVWYLINNNSIVILYHW